MVLSQTLPSSRLSSSPVNLVGDNMIRSKLVRMLSRNLIYITILLQFIVNDMGSGLW